LRRLLTLKLAAVREDGESTRLADLHHLVVGEMGIDRRSGLE
jgi:hypothetical protein